MTGNATITVDRESRVLAFRAEGLFDEDGVARLARAKAAAIQSLGGRSDDHVSIVDVTGCKIQSQDVVTAFASMMGDQALASRKTAFVAGPGCLIRLQIRRTTAHRDSARMFDNVDTARHWVLSDG